ncbi:MAG: L-fucose/L-arabinose isomerase family protein [Anaerolineae bacterium]|nr:L-fucose/L-arabinose isomerase family protein [Anaerolineae bacterium]
MTTLGVIVGNRGFFPSELCEEGRATILRVLEDEGIQAIALGPEDTAFGAVETWEDSKKCAELFKAHREEIDGILVTLPNFGEERGVADTVRLAGLNVPVLVHAYPDDPGKLDIANRRDSFCGKMSSCNNLSQYGIPYSLTTLHTVDPESESFRKDLQWFAGVCRVVKGLRKARFGQLGARPAAFITVRYSEKLLERAGIAVESVDLSEIFGRAWQLADHDPQVVAKLEEIGGYLQTGKTPPEALLKMAKFAVVMEAWIAEHELVGTAVQCWTSMEEYYGVVPCTVMSMLSNKLMPSACETDITGLIGMYAMVLASGAPSALLDWNNNYGDDPDKGVVFHCSNLPQEFFGNQAVMDYQEIIAGTVGKENTYGTLVGRIQPRKVTFCRVSTNDYTGKIRAYLGEAEITDDVVSTFGGYGVIQVRDFQKLLHHICEHGFEHHVALNPSQVADVLNEAFVKYLGWDVYYHQG